MITMKLVQNSPAAAGFSPLDRVAHTGFVYLVGDGPVNIAGRSILRIGPHVFHKKSQGRTCSSRN